MKKLFMSLVAILAVFGFSLNVHANPPATLKTGKMTRTTDYVKGYPNWIKNTLDKNYWLLCEVNGLPFPAEKTIKLNGEADKGFYYMLTNRPNTGDKAKDYYIMQKATWWYLDVINGTKNLDNNFKNSCSKSTSGSVCKEIVRLVEGAKAYKEKVGKVTITTSNNNLTKSGNYFYSDVIKVTSSNLNKFNGLKLVNAPAGAEIIENKVNNKGNGTFKVKVPVSSVKEGQTIKFNVEAKGNYNTYHIYSYTYDKKHQDVVFDKIYTKTVNLSSLINLTVFREKATTTKPKENSLTIYKEDEKGNRLSGVKLSLYKGDCTTGDCDEANLYQSFTSNKNGNKFINVPVGTYTLVEDKALDGYKLAEKKTIEVKDKTKTDYVFTLINYYKIEVDVKISKTDVTGELEIPGALLEVKDKEGNLIEAWVSEDKPKYIKLTEGEYSLTETLAPEGYKLSATTIYFKIDSKGNIYGKNEAGEYVLTDHIKMVNELIDKVIISKLDKDTLQLISGAVLEILNEKGEVVYSFTTSSNEEMISLKEGLYTLREKSAPEGYILNDEVIKFKVDSEGKLYTMNKDGDYVLTRSLIFYNTKAKADEMTEEEIEVPKTDASTTFMYVSGVLTLLGGAYMLKENEIYNK